MVDGLPLPSETGFQWSGHLDFTDKGLFCCLDENVSSIFRTGVELTRSGVDQPTADVIRILRGVVPYPNLIRRPTGSCDAFRRFFRHSFVYDALLLNGWKFELRGSQVRWMTFPQGVDIASAFVGEDLFVFVLTVSKGDHVLPLNRAVLEFPETGFPGTEWRLNGRDCIVCVDDDTRWRRVHFRCRNLVCLVYAQLLGEPDAYDDLGFDTRSTGPDSGRYHLITSTSTRYSMTSCLPLVSFNPT
jgi:hypothetical protein